VAFDQEEIGLLGSSYFVTQFHKMGRKVDAYINLDMIGYYDDAVNSQPFPAEFKDIFRDAYAIVDQDRFRANFILNTSNERSRKLMEKFDSCAMLFVPGLKVLSLPVMDDGRFAPGAFRSSDHVNFWNAGIDAIAIGDTGGVRNTSYHSPGDVVETLNFNFICNVSKAVLCTTLYLAQFDGKKISTGNSTAKQN
jgi:Zn-dependent M28 family amino/carboxypeptidase